MNSSSDSSDERAKKRWSNWENPTALLYSVHPPQQHVLLARCSVLSTFTYTYILTIFIYTSINRTAWLLDTFFRQLLGTRCLFTRVPQVSVSGHAARAYINLPARSMWSLQSPVFINPSANRSPKHNRRWVTVCSLFHFFFFLFLFFSSNLKPAPGIHMDIPLFYKWTGCGTKTFP